MCKKCLVFVMCFLCLCLVACGKEKSVEETSAVITTEESTEDPFAIKEGEFVYAPDGTTAVDSTEESIEEETTEESPEEKEITKELESREAESEPYVYTDISGVEEDARVEMGYEGLLKNIADKGGIEEVVSNYDRDDLEYLWDIYVYATKEEKNKFLDVIYSGTSEEKKALEEEVLHTQAGWYQDESGNWIDVYTVDKWGE